MCEVALTTRSRGIFLNPRKEGAKLGTQYSIIRCPTREPNKYRNPQQQWKVAHHESKNIQRCPDMILVGPDLCLGLVHDKRNGTKRVAIDNLA
jgi:hypothetical protein